jgi:hypothetical protein
VTLTNVLAAPDSILRDGDSRLMPEDVSIDHITARDLATVDERTGLPRTAA